MSAPEGDLLPVASGASPAAPAGGSVAPGTGHAVTGPDLAERRLYVNRELSLLQFQWRVFEEARDPANPLLERVKFLAIVAANLDEFFMVRVAGLKGQLAAGVSELSADGLTPAEQLAAIRAEVMKLGQAMTACLHDELLPQLAAADIQVLDYPQLGDRQRELVSRYFDELVFPVLTPLAVDPGRPFPHISNLSLNLAVLIAGPDGTERFARVKVPDTLPRLVPLARPAAAQERDDATPRHHAFVWLEQLIAAHVDRLFPGMTVVEVHPFHVARDAEVPLQEIEAPDLLESIEKGVRQRRFGSVVRLTVTANTSARIRRLLMENLEIGGSDVLELSPPFGLSGIMALAALDRPDLKYASFVPAIPPALTPEEAADVFAAIRKGDILLHHPFDSFAPVIDFLRTAARDPDVLAIKMTLYRVGRNAPVVQALLEASQNGKQVAVLVELKARFDEESNIGWARALEAEGVHVIYGLVGLKIHSKIALVVRREGTRLVRYVHLSTGNYNAVTAGLYTDLGYLTADPDVGEDATHLFNYLTGYAQQRSYRKLLVAPTGLRRRLLSLVEREVEHQRAGRGGHVIFKVNALVDREVCRALMAAARAGVRVDLLVRGISCLRPGIPGLSDGITITSIVGRFLEHSRIWWFRNGGEEEVYLGSADFMPRNLDRRVEVVFPIRDPALVRHLRDEVLQTYLSDNVRARRMLPDGSYRRLAPGAGEQPIDSQAVPLAVRAARRER